MNEGSNPVGVAAANVAESLELSNQVLNKDQGDVSPVSQVKDSPGPDSGGQGEESGRLEDLPDSPTCSKCGKRAAEVDSAGLCPACLKPPKAKRGRPRKVSTTTVVETPSGESVDPVFNEARAMCQMPECERFAASPAGFCAVHDRPSIAAEVGKCARLGCDHFRVFGSIWCSGHALCDASATCDNLPAVPPVVEDPREKFGNHEGGEYEMSLADIPEDPGQPNDGPRKVVPRDVLVRALDWAWEALADDGELDPVTVAVCKRLHDLQVAL